MANSSHLTLVAAPAGWGKTTLISQWTACQPPIQTSIAWLSFDATDKDPTLFVLYLIAALAETHPGLGDTARRLVLMPQVSSHEVVLTVLLNEVSELDRRVILVLDDYHLIKSSPIHESVAFVLDHLPTCLHLIIATRADPPLPLSKMRARGQLLEVRSNDLCFTHEEASEFLNTVMGLALEAEVISRMETQTEGWIAGLRLAAQHLQVRDSARRQHELVADDNRHILDFLFDEVLACQPEDVQTFLIETSVATRLCGPLCEALAGLDKGTALLGTVITNNLFLFPVDGERKWFRYHGLFRELLRSRLKKRGEERTAELHHTAALWYQRQGMVEDAIFHAVEGRNLELAAELAETHWDAVWMHGGLRTVATWIKALPAEWIRERPMLAHAQAAIYLCDGEYIPAFGTLDGYCADVSPDHSLPHDLRGREVILRSNIVRRQGNTYRAAEFAREGLDSLASGNHEWRAYARFSLGAALLEEGRVSDATDLLRDAMEESRRLDLTHIFALAAASFAQLLEMNGSLHEAALIYESALANATDHDYHHATELTAVFAGLGRIHYEWNDLERAEAYLSEGLKVNHKSWPPLCHFELLRLRKAQHDTDGVTELAAQLEAAARDANHPWRLAELSAVKIGMEQGSRPDGVTGAAEWKRTIDADAARQRPFCMPFHLRQREELTWARVGLTEGAFETVRELLESGLEALVQHGCHGTAIEYRIMLAVLHYQRGRPGDAIEVLEPALSMAATAGYTRVFLDAGRTLVPVLRECAARGIEEHMVTKVLNSFHCDHFVLPEAGQNAAAHTESLSLREREVLRLVAAGLSNSEIAGHLFLSVGTVKRHTHNTYIKLGVGTRMKAITRARELNAI